MLEKAINKLDIDKKMTKHFDYSILITAVLIIIFGAVNIYSSTYGKQGYTSNYKLQLIWMCIGIVIALLIACIDYRTIANYAPIFYWISILFLIYNNLFSSAINGASGWITFGSRMIQPSEFAKIAMLVYVAKKIQDLDGNLNNVKNLMKVGIIAAIPMVLIVIQPDMGMTMVTFFMLLGVVYIAGLNSKTLVGGLLGIYVSITVLWNSPMMPDYWKKRLTVFLNPEQDELGYGLQLIQSQIGIGSGGISGNGIKFGPHSYGGFVSQWVPESHTDFIFAMIGEKWGILGAVILLSLYGFLFYRIYKIARNAKDLVGRIISVGILSGLVFSVLQNIGMTIGIMPITGITLPFVSYGGSSMLTNFISLGLILNIGMRKKKINF